MNSLKKSQNFLEIINNNENSKNYKEKNMREKFLFSMASDGNKKLNINSCINVYETPKKLNYINPTVEKSTKQSRKSIILFKNARSITGEKFITEEKNDLSSYFNNNYKPNNGKKNLLESFKSCLRNSGMKDSLNYHQNSVFNTEGHNNNEKLQKNYLKVAEEREGYDSLQKEIELKDGYFFFSV